PKRALGRRTEECIRAGVILGTVDMIDGLVRRLKKEWPTPRTPKVVATGGLADVVAPLCEEIERVEPYLTLYGLQMAYALLEPAAKRRARSAASATPHSPATPSATSSI